MNLRPSYWLWRFHIWRTAHLMPEWLRYKQAQIDKARKAHRATEHYYAEIKRWRTDALRKEVRR